MEAPRGAHSQAFDRTGVQPIAELPDRIPRHCATPITVGAMADVNEGGFGLAAFSSRGPTRDERVKPDISAPGVNISAPKANSTNQYVVYSGTSMATPFDGFTPRL